MQRSASNVRASPNGACTRTFSTCVRPFPPRTRALLVPGPKPTPARRVSFPAFAFFCSPLCGLCASVVQTPFYLSRSTPAGSRSHVPGPKPTPAGWASCSAFAFFCLPPLWALCLCGENAFLHSRQRAPRWRVGLGIGRRWARSAEEGGPALTLRALCRRIGLGKGPHRPPALRAVRCMQPGQVVPATAAPPTPSAPSPTSPPQQHKPPTQHPHQQRIEQNIRKQPTPEREQRQVEVITTDHPRSSEAPPRNDYRTANILRPIEPLPGPFGRYFPCPHLDRQRTPRPAVRGDEVRPGQGRITQVRHGLLRKPRQLGTRVELNLNVLHRQLFRVDVDRDLRQSESQEHAGKPRRLMAFLEHILPSQLFRRRGGRRHAPRHRPRQHQSPAQVHPHNPHAAHPRPTAPPRAPAAPLLAPTAPLLARIPCCAFGSAHPAQSTRPCATAL